MVEADVTAITAKVAAVATTVAVVAAAAADATGAADVAAHTDPKPTGKTGPITSRTITAKPCP